MLRVRVPERMDDPALEPGAHLHALEALERSSRLLGVNRQLYRCACRLARGGPWSLLDLGAGGGGFLAYVTRGASSGSRRLVALDCSTLALGRAVRRCSGAVRAVAADARRVPLADNSVDLVASSLFLHHFDPPDVMTILREAARVARRGIVMGDLTRSRRALALTWVGTRLLSRSQVFRTDGPRSVRAAFRVEEMRDLARSAGLRGAQVRSRFPFRLVLTWCKEAC